MHVHASESILMLYSKLQNTTGNSIKILRLTAFASKLHVNN